MQALSMSEEAAAEQPEEEEGQREDSSCAAAAPAGAQNGGTALNGAAGHGGGAAAEPGAGRAALPAAEDHDRIIEVGSTLLPGVSHLVPAVPASVIKAAGIAALGTFGRRSYLES